MCWTASINYLMDIGIENINAHNMEIGSYLLDNLDMSKYQIISPLKKQWQSSIVALKPLERHVDDINEELVRNNIYVSIRQGNIRISPHIYNNINELAYLLNILNK